LLKQHSFDFTPDGNESLYESDAFFSQVHYGQSSKPTTSSGVQLEAMDYTKAQKYCKYASSALQYEDVPTAIDNLQKALRLLQTGKDDSG
jgi:flagellin-specific chaperone FliS